MICRCCGVYVPPGAEEMVLVGPDGDDEYMYRRCFNEECDCNDNDVDNMEPPRPEPTGEPPDEFELMFGDEDEFEDDLPF